jgi:hypothetical protein
MGTGPERNLGGCHQEVLSPATRIDRIFFLKSGGQGGIHQEFQKVDSLS